MQKLKLMTILGTRPEIIRLSSTIKKADKYFNHTLVHTGQNYDYELNEVFFENLGLRSPDRFLGAVGDDLGATMGNIIDKSYKVINEIKPDALLVLGDTNSALSAISAKRLKVPIFHMEAGNRCWDWNVSEMVNRKIVDHISDVNLPYTEHARRYLISEGIDPKTIFVTGSPMVEVLSEHKKSIEESSILTELNLEKRKYFLVSSHREENIDNEKNFEHLMSSLNYMVNKYDMPVLFSVHPRTKKFIEEREYKFDDRIIMHKPFGFFDYNFLQMNSFCVLSDSGTLSEESALLNFPSVLIRTSTERPEVLDKGSIVIGGITKQTIEQSVELATNMFENDEIIYTAVDYTDVNTSVKVIKLIQSYTDIVNRTVWLKS